MWGNCGEVLKDKLQVQQNRAARIIEMVKYEDADHEQLLINLAWLSVRNILAYELGVFMFKAVNKLAPEEINNLFMKQYEIHSHGTRSVEEGNLFLPQRNLSKGQEAISYTGAKFWNEIPAVVKETQSIDTFKGNLKKYLLNIQTTSMLDHVSGR